MAMAKIDVHEWHRFSLSELGFSNFHGQRLNKANRIEGDKPFLTAGKENNGLTMYVGNDRPMYHNPITVDMFGNCFYQPFDCAGDDNVYFFVNNDISARCKMFISSSINVETTLIYAYVDQFRQSQADNLSVNLPVDTLGEPDWGYMDSYMAQVIQEAEQSLDAFESADGRTKGFDVTAWKEFIIGDLFEVVKGTRLTKANMKSGEMRFIGSSAMNNGITAYVSNNERLHPANTLTVCYNGSIGETFYQDEPFWASDDVNVLYPKFDMTCEVALFIAPILKRVSERYMYTDKWKKETMESDSIKLPVDVSGEPDWSYMRAYMAKVMQESEKVIEELSSVGVNYV